MRAQRTSLTFSALVADYLADQRAARVKTVDEIERALRVDALPVLGNRQPAAITDVQIEAVVDAVADRGKTAMARHLLAYLRGCFNHALRGSPALREKYGLRFNPADTVGRGRRGKAGKYGRPAVDDRHLVDAEIIAFWRALQASRAEEQTKIVLKLLLLTGQRPSEVRCTRNIRTLACRTGAPIGSCRATEPRMAIHTGFRSYLRPSSCSLVLPSWAMEHPSHFPRAALGTAHWADTQSIKLLSGYLQIERLRIEPFSPKDLRSTVKTGMARLGITKEVRDAVQNHKPQGVGDRAYNFHAYAKEKRLALQQWTNHVAGIVGASE